MDLLEQFAKFPKLSEVDALAVVILSHGGQNGIIYGKDGSQGQHYITDDMIHRTFSAKNCPLMEGKPKLFVIQACRGSEFHSMFSFLVVICYLETRFL